MDEHQTKLAEELIDVTLLEADARFIQQILINDSELTEEENFKLLRLYEENFGYYGN